MAQDLVTITHDKVKGEGKVTRTAFEQVWKDRGWSIKKDEQKTKQETKGGS
jgi:hypothetical protein